MCPSKLDLLCESYIQHWKQNVTPLCRRKDIAHHSMHWNTYMARFIDIVISTSPSKCADFSVGSKGEVTPHHP